jgi:lipopolysaccharide transport system permease protein/teichoic acid transport system permease protein
MRVVASGTTAGAATSGRPWDGLLTELRSVVRYRELVRHLVRAALAKESTGRVFGALWWLIDPLVLVAVYVFFVDVILQSGGEDFALFVLVGALVWKHLSSGVITSMTTTLAREQAMRQVAFPRAVLPLSAVLAETIHLALGLLVYVAAAIVFGVVVGPAFLFVLPLVAIQVVLVLGLSLALAAVNVLYRDVQNLTSYVLRVGFFLSPALYAIDQIPESARPVYLLNPFATLIPAFRDVMLYDRQPDWSAVGLVGLGSVVTLVAGFVVFTRLERWFAKVS